MSSQAQTKHKVGSRPSKGKFEVINERLIFTPNDKDNGTFTIKLSDIDIIDNQKSGWLNSEIRIITKNDQIHFIKKVTPADAETATAWLQSMLNPITESDQIIDKGGNETKESENRIVTTPKKELTDEEHVQGGNVILLIVTIVLVVLGTNLGGFWSLLTLAPCYAIRARETVATKDQKALDRIKNRKNHKVRLISSLLRGVIGVMLVAGAFLKPTPPTKPEEKKQEVVVEKGPIPEELAKIKADKKAEEQRLADEKKKQEEYEKSPEYKLKVQKEKIEKVIKQRGSEMYLHCQKSIKQLLTYPETADFPWIDYTARPFGESIVIKSYVKYKNAYGIPLKSNFRCEYKEVDGNWSLVDGGLEQ